MGRDNFLVRDNASLCSYRFFSVRRDDHLKGQVAPLATGSNLEVIHLRVSEIHRYTGPLCRVERNLLRYAV